MENEKQTIFLDTEEQSGIIMYPYGLTKREHFASIAMQGLISNSQPNKNQKHLAGLAVSYADALLEQLDYDKNN